MLRVPYQNLFESLRRVLVELGFDEERAGRCAQLFAEASRDGVYSHGLNRFPLFVSQIRSGIVDIHAEPGLLAASGSLERWDGNSGPGNLNAQRSMERAIALARQHGVGCVALANTNHWMRGGSYGWQAADAGVIGICWTNTLPNLPPWGTSVPLLGNNPLVIAVPRPSGHIVLDMAMSQFSYGALAAYRARGELLPVEGGFDLDGHLTRNPEVIESSRRPLPIGYWKGSGLALMLDLIAGVLSGGSTTHQIPAEPELETRLSQVFLAFDPSFMAVGAALSPITGQVIAELQSQAQIAGEDLRYPGQRVLQVRQENLQKGVPIDPAIWAQVQEMLTSH
jgi:3-dehydro-L-gulonate 2-dehydrogenase